MPLRADLDPADLRDLLSSLIIVEVEHQPTRFRYRLVGTRVVDFNKMEFTGRYLGTIGWEEEEQLVEVCTDVAVSRQPLFGFYTWTTRNGNIAKCEFGSFPFSHDGQTVAQIVAIEDYDFPLEFGDGPD